MVSTELCKRRLIKLLDGIPECASLPPCKVSKEGPHRAVGRMALVRLLGSMFYSASMVFTGYREGGGFTEPFEQLGRMHFSCCTQQYNFNCMRHVPERRNPIHSILSLYICTSECVHSPTPSRSDPMATQEPVSQSLPLLSAFSRVQSSRRAESPNGVAHISPTQARLPSLSLYAGDRHLDGRVHGLHLRRPSRVHAHQLLVAQRQKRPHHLQQVRKIGRLMKVWFQFASTKL